MPLTPLQPPVTHGRDARNAVKLTDTELAPEQQAASMEAGFGEISSYLAENELALQNVLRQRRNKNTDRRLISEIGYRELSSIGVINQGTVPVFQYIPPKADAVLLRKEGSVPNIFVIHSFGGGVDLGKLKNRNVRSIAVDPETGFNAARYYNGIRELVTPGSAKSIHHIISRRGDLTNSAPWDTIAFHGGGPMNGTLSPSITHLSIGVELEEYYIRHSDEKNINGIINRVPYTEQQYAVIAFLLKKYIAWTGNADILKWLGPGPETLTNVRNGQSGCVIHRAFSVVPALKGQPNPNPEAHWDPSAEFLFPQGFRKGDPLPSHLQVDELGNDTTAQYLRRIELFWGHVPNGTLLSAWDRIFDKVEKLRAFDLNKDVFDTSFAKDRILLETPTIKGTHLAAAANLSGRDQITQVQRSQAIQNQSRSELYSKAQTTSATVKANYAEEASRLVSIGRKVGSEPTITNARLFNYQTGQWETSTTRNKV